MLTPPLSCMHAKSLQSCLILCDLTDYSLPGSSIHVILQARILECVAIGRHRKNLCLLMSPALAGGFFTTSTTSEAPMSVMLHRLTLLIFINLFFHTRMYSLASKTVPGTKMLNRYLLNQILLSHKFIN